MDAVVSEPFYRAVEPFSVEPDIVERHPSRVIAERATVDEAHDDAVRLGDALRQLRHNDIPPLAPSYSEHCAIRGELDLDDPERNYGADDRRFDERHGGAKQSHRHCPDPQHDKRPRRQQKASEIPRVKHEPRAVNGPEHDHERANDDETAAVLGFGPQATDRNKE